MRAKSLRVVLVKPTKYKPDGWVERFKKGLVPNSTLLHLRSLTPSHLDGAPIDVHMIDEYVENTTEYLKKLHGEPGRPTLLALVGVQSNQFHRALDLAAYARANGVEHAIIGGAHPMTCDTTACQGRGVSFSLTEAESAWTTILSDALDGELQPVYSGNRWVPDLRDVPPLTMPERAHLKRFAVPMVGVYPSRGCPYDCSFCSVIKLAGRAVRSEPIETTLETIRRAKRAGVPLIYFVSDNLNKSPDLDKLLEAIIDSRIKIRWAAQVDAQIADEPDLLSLMSRSGCISLFVGGENFTKANLNVVDKHHNAPKKYAEIIRLFRANRIVSVFATIIGFPADTRETVAEHLAGLNALDPDIAPISLLTPIPGTRMYDEHLATGMLTQPNLDYYDTNNLVWNHPTLTSQQLIDLRDWCGKEFNRPRLIAQRFFKRFAALSWSRPGRLPSEFMTGAFGTLLQTLTVFAGFLAGVGDVMIDKAADYLELRRKTYGFDLAPLPVSLTLSDADTALNRNAKLRRRTLDVVA
jgi:radical SAM superfamily enzyme YgiQ (UPF0313 family)